jgi:MFS family permease
MADLVPDPRPDQPRSLPLLGALGGLKRGFEALGVRNYRLYWSGQVVSLVGTWMQQVSLPWLVLSLGGTPLQLGFVAVLQFGPAMILAPFGGVFADRLDKRLAMMVTQAAAAGQAFVLFLLTATGVVEIWMVMTMALVLGLVNAIDMPLRQSLAPDLVPRRLLANAIALNSMAFNSARVVGPAVAGVIIAIGTGVTGSAVAGVAINLGINTLTYAAVMISLSRMDPDQIRRHAKPAQHPPVLESLREGFSYAVRTPLVLWCLVLLGGIAAFGFNFQILLPLFADDVLGLGAAGYGGLYAAMGVGSLAGSLTLAYMSSRRAIPLMLGGGLVFSTLLIGIAASSNVWVAAALILGAGYSSMLMINTINATVQANTPDALRGRVMSFYVTVFAGSAPLGGLFAGAVAEAWGVPAAFLAGAALSFLTLGVVALGLRAARRRGQLGVTSLDGSRTPSRAPGAPEARGVSAAR